jgi:hypothetical protein
VVSTNYFSVELAGLAELLPFAGFGVFAFEVAALAVPEFEVVVLVPFVDEVFVVVVVVVFVVVVVVVFAGLFVAFVFVVVESPHPNPITPRAKIDESAITFFMLIQVSCPSQSLRIYPIIFPGGMSPPIAAESKNSEASATIGIGVSIVNLKIVNWGHF